MSDFSDLETATVLDTKIKEVDNKLPDLRCLVKKRDYHAEISETETKHFTTSDYDKFMSNILDATIK